MLAHVLHNLLHYLLLSNFSFLDLLGNEILAHWREAAVLILTTLDVQSSFDSGHVQVGHRVAQVNVGDLVSCRALHPWHRVESYQLLAQG